MAETDGPIEFSIGYCNYTVKESWSSCGGTASNQEITAYGPAKINIWVNDVREILLSNLGSGLVNPKIVDDQVMEETNGSPSPVEFGVGNCKFTVVSVGGYSCGGTGRSREITTYGPANVKLWVADDQGKPLLQKQNRASFDQDASKHGTTLYGEGSSQNKRWRGMEQSTTSGGTKVTTRRSPRRFISKDKQRKN